jgi:membrane associated rhomboid family serine protease
MVFLPLKDDNQLKFIWFQYSTVLLIAINTAVFVWQQSMGAAGLNEIPAQAGVIPASVFGGAPLPQWLFELPSETTLVTYMFLHGDWWHLIGNMLFLWVFGDNVEDAMGSIRFLLFYLLCGVAAGLAHVLANAGSEAPLVGASGAVAGIIGAYLMLYPKVWMWSLAFMRIPLKLPAYLVIAAWVATQIFFVVYDIQDGTAWWAHIGGFAAGVVLVFIFKRADQPLFGGAPQR